MESTYGDRLHGPIEESSNALAEAITRTCRAGGKVIIPSFALERAQEIIFELKRLKLARRIPAMPVYVDSPLTVKLTEIFKLHPDCYDRETFELLRGGQSPFDFDGLRVRLRRWSESKAIDASDQPCVIISASGMCEGGRVLHHLRSHHREREEHRAHRGVPGPAHPGAPAGGAAAARCASSG